MSTLTIRNIDDETKRRLRIRAAENGRSMEAEVRLLIARSLAGEGRPSAGPGPSIVDLLLAPHPKLDDDFEFPSRGNLGLKPVDLPD